MEKQIPYLVAIERACGLTWTRFQRLNQFFEGDFKRAFHASVVDWKAAKVDKRGIDRFFRCEVFPDEEMDKVHQCEAQVLVYGGKNFPINLLNIPQPPTLLFTKGQISASDFPALAVVGSRRLTDYGRSSLESLLTPTITNGVTTVSGLALGTDRLVHECSLKNAQRTLAVLGSGIDQVYPKSHEKLARQILENGALISEYLPGIKPRAEYFPQRNRIISGLAKAVVLIEAAERSGTLITAAWANDQGRDIFAVPGSIFSSQSKGTNQLIAQGMATSLVDPEQIAGLFTPKAPALAPDLAKLGAIDRAIIDVLVTQGPLHIDDLVRELALSSAVVSSQLMLLEVRGWVKDTGQQHFISQL